MATTNPDQPHTKLATAGTAEKRGAAPMFRGWQWRAGNTLVSILARAGVGPIELLTTEGRVSGRPHTVPVVPIDHAGTRWLVAPYGPVAWVHNARARGVVTLRYGRRRRVYAVREATPMEAAPILKRYVTVATRTRHRFAATVDAPVEAFIAEAADHPVFQLHPPSKGSTSVVDRKE
ncbi:MAG TPA: nitroreductase family deazaflavin-dependent oxidoreductase [Candidatus Limnocylindria bacterium]|nr:nitroreductase family deazaflavin-dependent oxidoreductase [Candidatus Limnocylindria bacterium]